MKKLIPILILAACAKGSVDSPDAMAKAPKFGMSVSDAGVVLDDAGLASIYLDGGVAAILGNPGSDHCIISTVTANISTGNFTAQLSCGPYVQNVQGQFGPAVQAAMFTQIKAAAAAQGIQ